MKIKVAQCRKEDLLRESGAMMFDRPPEIGSKAVMILHSSLSDTKPDWAINRGKGDQGAARRFIVPLYRYAVTQQLRGGIELAMTATSLADAAAQHANLQATHRINLIVVPDDDSHLLFGVYITPIEF